MKSKKKKYDRKEYNESEKKKQERKARTGEREHRASNENPKEVAQKETM